MSQKKLKKLKKESNQKGIVLEEKVMGIREILKKNWKFLVILLIGVVGIYFNSLNGAFVSDDYATIPQNPEIMSFSAATKGSLVAISNWLIAITFGIKNPIPYHVVNLIMYLILCVLAFVFLNVIFDKKTAIFSTILFAVLPVHVEAVSWISGKPYLFTSISVLLSLIMFVYYLKTGIKKYLWFFIISLPIAFFSEKVRSLSIIFLIPLLPLCFDFKFKSKFDFKKIFMVFGTLMLVAAIILWPQINNRIQSVNSGINASDSIFYNPFFQYPTAITKYLQLILVPVDLTLYHTMYTVPVWLNWVIFLTYLGAVIWYFFKDRKMFFALAFIFAATAPSMAPIKVSWLVAERYLLLGSLGFCVFLVLFFQKFNKRAETYIFIVFVMLIGAFSTRVFLRNIDWQTNHNLWVNTCQVSPNSHNAWNNIGDDYDKLGQYENAIKGFGQSFAIKPNYADAYHNQANIFYKIGRLDLARKGYETALYYNPALTQTYQTLIQLDIIEKNRTELSRHLNTLISLQPNDLQIRYIAAIAYQKVGMLEEAKKIADEMYKYYPNIKEIKNLYDSLTVK